MQPWKVYVVNGESMGDLLNYLEGCDPIEEPEYDVYPSGLWEPHRTARFALGEQMYGLLDIPREDKAGRLQQFARNARFFDAPAAFFITIDRRFNKPQWSDLGMFLQTFMLLAVEAGQQGSPGGTADGVVVKTREAQTSRRQRVYVRGVDLPTVASEVGPAHVVDHNQQDIRPFLGVQKPEEHGDG